MSLCAPGTNYGKTSTKKKVAQNDDGVCKLSSVMDLIVSREELKGGLTDKKVYRLLQLSNGLECLLISEPKECTGHDSIDSEDSESDSEDDVSGDDGSDEDEEEDRAPQRAACAMAVGVGSWADGTERPGAAHFLEHMLFMGTAKYETENEYESFLSRHGGSCNAQTEVEWTSYHLDVSNDFLQGALDRFSEFFVQPLMREDGIAREVKSIESEFQETVRCDEARIDELLFHQVGKQPFNSFCWGNALSLHDGDTIAQDCMKRIFQEHYHAFNMKFAMISTFSLDTMEDMILQSGLPNIRESPESPPKFFSTTSTWRRSAWNTRPLSTLKTSINTTMLLRVVPLAEKYSIRLIWSLDPICCLTDWAQRTEDACAHLLGHEGRGSATAELRRRGLITDLMAGTGDEGYAKSGACGSWFTITVHLTPTALSQWARVVDIIFKYAAKCHAELENDPQQADDILDELTKISGLKFDYGEEYDDRAELVEDLALCMLPLYSEKQPRSELLRYNTGCFLKPDRDKLIEMLSIIKDVKACHSIQLLSSAFSSAIPIIDIGDQSDPLLRSAKLGTMRPDRAPDIESRFGTEFWQDELNPELLEFWARKLKNNDYDLALPEKNAYLPRDLKLISPSKPLSTAPYEELAARIDFRHNFNTETSTTQKKKKKKLAIPSPQLGLGPKSRKKGGKKDTKKICATDSAAVLWARLRSTMDKGEDDDKEIICIPREVDAYPVEFAPECYLCKRSSRFDRPLAEIRVRLFSPAMLQGAAALARMERAVVRTLETVAESAYAASTAELHYGVLATEASVLIKLGGWSDPLPRLLDLILQETTTQLRHWDDDNDDIGKYGAADEKYCRALRNAWFVDPAKMARDMRLTLLCPDMRAFPAAKLSALSGTATPSPIDFSVSMLVHGNADEKYAATVKEIIENHTASASISANRPPVRVRRLAPGETRIVQGSIDPDCPTTAIEFYWQLGSDDPELRVATELLEAILDEPLYDRLRTQEQLGYTCSCGSRWTAGVVGFGVRLVSDKASPMKLEKRLRAFLTDFRQNVLLLNDEGSSNKGGKKNTFDEFVSTDFLDHCRGLAHGKLEEERSLCDAADKDWSAILDRLPFSTALVEALALRNITPKALCATFDRIFGFGSHEAAPCLITAVVGRGSSWLLSEKNSPNKFPVPPQALLNGVLLNDDAGLLSFFQESACGSTDEGHFFVWNGASSCDQ